jgi:membrane protein implicated in regulation of membrane protease activity
MTIKVNANSVATLALVICIGMSVFWLMIGALADELDPIVGVASFTSLISMALAFAVAITAAVYTMVKNRKTKSLSGRRRHRSDRDGKYKDSKHSAAP